MCTETGILIQSWRVDRVWTFRSFFGKICQNSDLAIHFSAKGHSLFKSVHCSTVTLNRRASVPITANLPMGHPHGGVLRSICWMRQEGSHWLHFFPNVLKEGRKEAWLVGKHHQDPVIHGWVWEGVITTKPKDTGTYVSTCKSAYMHTNVRITQKNMLASVSKRGVWWWNHGEATVLSSALFQVFVISTHF